MRQSGAKHRLTSCKSRLWQRILAALACAIILFAVPPAAAQNRRPWEVPRVTKGIPEDKRPWPGKPWLAGILLTLAVVGVSIKNAKRTHLD